MRKTAEIVLFQDHESAESLAPALRSGQHDSYCFLAFPVGSAKATYMPPCGLLGVRALLAAITTYWRPSTMYVEGVATPAKGNSPSHSSLPVLLSKARSL